MKSSLAFAAIFAALAVLDAVRSDWQFVAINVSFALLWLVVWRREQENDRLRKRIGDLAIDLKVERLRRVLR